MRGEGIFIIRVVMGRNGMVAAVFFRLGYCQAHVVAVHLAVMHVFQVILPVENVRQAVAYPGQQRLRGGVQVKEE